MRFEKLLNLLFPENNVCVLCERALLPEEDFLCARCGKALEECAISRVERLCPAEGTLYAVSAYWHDREASRLVHMLKFDGIAVSARLLAKRMVQAARDCGALDASDLIVPVPVHPKRLRERGYNQAEKLAEAVREETGLPCCPAALRKTSAKRSQVGHSREERLEAMRTAFEGDPVLLCGKRVLLVDDVFTTGATASACASALLKAGAAEVRALTATRA